MTCRAAANADHASAASGSSFYAAMRMLPRAQRQAMFQIYSFCREVDGLAIRTGRDRNGWPRCNNGATTSMRYITVILRRVCRLRSLGENLGLKREDFLAIVDGMRGRATGHSCAGYGHARSVLRSRCERCRAAVGQGVRPAENDGILLAHHLGRALQLTNILRDIDENAGLGRLYLPREGLLLAGITSDNPQKVIAERSLPKVCQGLVGLAKAHFEKADEIMKRNSRRKVRAPRIMGKYYRAILDLLIARGFAAPREPVRVNKMAKIAILLRYAII